MVSYLGMDVSKGYCDFALLDSGKAQLEEIFQMDDTRNGHVALKKHLEAVIKTHGITRLYCGMESTGGLENNWYNSLMEWGKTMPLSVARLNPAGVKKSKEACLSRNVTDELSSVHVAGYLVSYGETVRYDKQDGRYASCRSLHKHINLLKKQKTQLVNQLKIALYSVFPEFVCYCKDGLPYWVLETLRQYGLPKRIAALDPAELSRIPHVSHDKATTIIKKARCTVASRSDLLDGVLVMSLAEQVLGKEKLINSLKKHLVKSCQGPEVDLIKTIVGIGDYSAAAVMVEIEDIRRFASAKKLVSYFGVHPELKESGDRKSKSNMSKKGRSSMRSVLFMCANAAVLHDAHMKSIYHKHRKKDLEHKQALGAIMQKLLRIIWGVLTSGTGYNPAVDRENQAKAVGKENNIEKTDIKRRYQEQDSEAPVSNKQAKTRRALKESQVPESKT
jgi:transposase